MMAVLRAAMRDPDNWVVRLRYIDAKGISTIRVVSPIRFENDSVVVLCLAREQCRRMILERVSDVKLLHSADVLMPVPILLA
jgi:hypothetical protein